MYGRFGGKTAIVTGAAGNIGRATARRLASEGAAVLCVDRHRDGAAETVRLIETDGGSARAFEADVSDAAAVRAYVAEAASLNGGGIDAFFNNAGIEGPVTGLEDYDEEHFDKVIAVNVRGVFLGLKHVSAAMTRGGAIVNTASVAGLVGFPGVCGYVASKHAVMGLTRAAALDLAPRGVRVNAICPGPVEGRMMTSLEKQVGDGGHDVFLSTVPLGRYAKAEEMAATVVFLLSSETSFATGAAFSIDGGQTSQ
ncbi:SDR family NAD(P)-dependent oxidoreductase [Streptomyces umbrinus]|uniref:SDR family NAD(P)-dependent oxidoreductase n=1 Tax=Streptomyces umbrinus TaxID=67370 RepID=UPI003C30489B